MLKIRVFAKPQTVRKDNTIKLFLEMARLEKEGNETVMNCHGLKSATNRSIEILIIISLPQTHISYDNSHSLHSNEKRSYEEGKWVFERIHGSTR